MKKVVFLLWSIPLWGSAQTLVTSYNTGTSFACITVDSNYNIWAGRNNGTGTGTNTGVYLLNKQANPTATQFTAVAGTTTYNIQALVADASQNVWAGHNGLGGSPSASGGIERIPINSGSTQHYAPDRNAECLTFFARDGLATLNCAGLAVDPQNGIWSAHKYHDLTVAGIGSDPPDYYITPGSFSFKPASSLKFFSKGTFQEYNTPAEPAELPYPAYTCNPSFLQTAQTRNVYAVACGANQAWVSVAAYTSKSGVSFPARILKYNLDGSYTGTFASFASIGIPAGGYFNGLYVSPTGDVWATMTSAKGFAVLHNNAWTHVNTSTECIFPSTSTLINTNAIWGNKLGQVFIGTNQGLIVYRGTGAVNLKTSYSLYTVANFGLLSNQILGGASEKNSIQWIATDNGIMRTTLGSNFPLAVDPFDYTMCMPFATKDAIQTIEIMITAPLAPVRQDYHVYNVETQVCDIAATTPNHRNCNAEYIYKMIRNDATFAAITPDDFPYDHLNSILLFRANKAAVNAMVEQRVNAWDPDSWTTLFTNEKKGIKYIWQVLNPEYAAINIANPGLIPLFPEPANKMTRAELTATQKAINPQAVVACSPYLLYNSDNYIRDRAVYKRFFDPHFCNSGLGNVDYDKVWIVPDDKNLTVTNYTQPGHILYPGKIFRSVVEECGKVKIVTKGIGLNYCGNGIPGKMNAIGNIITGSIVFKNIDERLKIAFEAAQ